MIWMMGLRMLSDCDNCLRKHLAVKYHDDIQSMEVSGYLCTLASAGLVGIEPSRNIYVPTRRSDDTGPGKAVIRGQEKRE